MPETTLRGTVVTPRGQLPGAAVRTDGAVITAVDAGSGGDTGCFILPGFVDLHNHGGLRGSFPDGTAEECATAAQYHRSHGTTTLLASLVSASAEHLLRQIPVLASLAENGEIAGIHLEGPFINAGKCGAQDPRAIIPGDPALFARLIEAGQGHVRSITFAPETPHVAGLLDLCARHDIVASLGHTDASFDDTTRVLDTARDKGVTVTATHLFNAMPAVHHRAPGAAAALITAAARGEIVVELVADGVHLADGTVDMVREAVGDHTAFVTDAMQAAGMPDGDYTLGTLDVTVDRGIARLRAAGGEQGAIAGGTTTLSQQVTRHLARGVDLPALVRATSTTPARVLGRSHELGDIAPGFAADLVVIDAAGHVRRVLKSRTS